MCFALTLAVVAEPAPGQSLYMGLAGGGSFTDGFQHRKLGDGAPWILVYPTHKDYLVGPAVELGLSRSISLGFEALYRPLNLTAATQLADGSLRSVSPATVVTWELPILARYKFTSKKWRPLLEAGPSFRTAGNLNATSPSSKGMTFGAGLETRFGVLRVTPCFRYTHWTADHLRAISGRTNQNQAVFLLGLSFGGSLK
jgi:hypothetical protein